MVVLRCQITYNSTLIARKEDRLRHKGDKEKDTGGRGGDCQTPQSRKSFRAEGSLELDRFCHEESPMSERR